MGTLYEACENQLNDALDAYTKALEYEPHNAVVKQRIISLKDPQLKGQLMPLAPIQPQPQGLGSIRYPSMGGSASGVIRVKFKLTKGP